jgi:hypothetical protein
MPRLSRKRRETAAALRTSAAAANEGSSTFGVLTIQPRQSNAFIAAFPFLSNVSTPCPLPPPLLRCLFWSRHALLPIGWPMHFICLRQQATTAAAAAAAAAAIVKVGVWPTG